MMSPHPDARRRNGDSAMTPVSMITAIGVWAARLTFSPSFWIEARDDTTPSWLAAVGTLTNGTPALKDAHFATSIERPPPTPSANSMFPLRIFSSPSRTSFIVASGIKNSEVRILRAASSFSTVMPAIFIVVSSATIKARFPSFSDWQTSPTACRASWPTTTFRGSSIAFVFEKDSVSIVDNASPLNPLQGTISTEIRRPRSRPPDRGDNRRPCGHRSAALQGAAGQRGHGSSVLRIVNELSEALEFRRLRLRGDDPPNGRLPVRWRLRLKELPSLPVPLEFPQLRLVKLRDFALLVRIDSRSIFRTCLERLKAGRLHAPLCTEGLDAFDIRNAPDAARFARRETDRIVDFAEAFSLPIDPSKAERSVDCLRPRDTGLARALFMESDP